MGVELQAAPLVEIGQVVGAVAVKGSQVEYEIVVAQHVGHVQVGGAEEAAAGVDAQGDRGQAGDEQLLEGLVFFHAQREGRGRFGGEHRRRRQAASGENSDRLLGQVGGRVLLEKQETPLVVGGDDQLAFFPGDFHREEIAGAHVAVAVDDLVLQVQGADIVGPELVGTVVNGLVVQGKSRGDVVVLAAGQLHGQVGVFARRQVQLVEVAGAGRIDDLFAVGGDVDGLDIGPAVGQLAHLAAGQVQGIEKRAGCPRCR